MINVGIDATQLVEKRTGLGRYQEDLIIGLKDQGDIELVLLAPPENTLPESGRWEIRILSRSLCFISPGLALLFASPKLLNGIDLFLASRVLRPLSWQGKTLTVVHDLAWLENAKGMQTFSYIAHRLFANRMIVGSNLVVSDSQRTTNRLKDLVSSTVSIHTLTPQISSKFHVSENRCYDSRKVLLVGGQSPGKNGALALKVFARVAEDIGDLELVIVGGKSWKNKEMLEEYKLIPAHIKQRIHMAGFVPESELIRLYQSSTLTLFPSYYEGYGYPVLESMACGTPILASRNIPTADYLPDDYYALAPDDEDSWYAISKSILSEPHQHHDKFMQHWKNIKGKFTGQDYSDKIVELIKSACLSR